MLRRLRNRSAGFSLDQPFYTDPDYPQARPRADLVSRLAVRRPRLRDRQARQLRHRAGRRLSGRHRARRRRRDPRLPQFLPPSRQPRLHRAQGHGAEARLPLSPVDLRARRRLLFARDMGAGLRHGAVRPEAGRLRDVGGHIFICLADEPPDFDAVRARCRAATSRRTGCARRRSPSRARSSRRATGSSSGRTTASATTARATIRRCAGPSRKRRPSPACNGADERSGDRRRIGRSARRPACRQRFQHRPERASARFVRMPLLARRRELHDGRQGGGRRSDLSDACPPTARLAAALPLSDHLEPLPRRPRDRLPRPADQRRPRPRSPPSGWSTRTRSRASTTTSTTDPGLDRDQRRGPRIVEENPRGIHSPAYRARPLFGDAGGRRDPVRRLVRRLIEPTASPSDRGAAQRRE